MLTRINLDFELLTMATITATKQNKYLIDIQFQYEFFKKIYYPYKTEI